MQALTFRDLIETTGGHPIGFDHTNDRLPEISTDSRTLRAGQLFWALQGRKSDGHKFLKQAFQAGAAAAVVSAGKSRHRDFPHIEVEDSLIALWQFANWYRTQFEALLIGVTGSVGKTTTRRMIASVLSSRFHGLQSPQNFNNEFGVPLTLLALRPEHEFAVIELAASQPGEIETLAAIAQPEVGVVTAIGPAHLDGFGSVDAIIRTKGELLEALPDSGFAVLNGDDRNVRGMLNRCTCPVILVGERDQQQLHATNVVIENERLSFEVDGQRFQVPATGRHHLTAALIAIAIARYVELSHEEIMQGLAAFTPAPGRCQPVQIGPWTVIDDTYNASPASMAAACQTLRDWNTDGKRILVAGDMLALGDWSADFHRLFGEEAARCRFDRLIAVGSQAAIVAGSARKHGMDAGCLGACRDQDLALMLLDCWLEPGDVLLVKGSRDMHMEALIPGLQKLSDARREQPIPLKRAA